MKALATSQSLGNWTTSSYSCQGYGLEALGIVPEVEGMVWEWDTGKGGQSPGFSKGGYLISKKCI